MRPRIRPYWVAQGEGEFTEKGIYVIVRASLRFYVQEYNYSRGIEWAVQLRQLASRVPVCRDQHRH